MKRAASNITRSTALWTALIVAFGVGISACSSEKEHAGAESGEVMAVDRVDAAADLARKNGPVAEEMVFEKTAPIAATAGEVDATASAEGATAAADMPEATAAADSNMADMPVADSTEMPAADAAVKEAKPAAN